MVLSSVVALQVRLQRNIAYECHSQAAALSNFQAGTSLCTPAVW
jgi:hypothetical protein